MNGHVRWGPICATEHRSAGEGWNADPCYNTYKPHGHSCTERGQVEEEGQETGSAQEGKCTDTDGSLCVGTGFLRGDSALELWGADLTALSSLRDTGLCTLGIPMTFHP